MWSYIFAGIGMIFIGGQFLSFGVKQAAGTRLRAVFTTATKGRWRTVGIGTLAGALLQSTNAVSFMAFDWLLPPSTRMKSRLSG